MDATAPSPDLSAALSAAISEPLPATSPTDQPNGGPSRTISPPTSTYYPADAPQAALSSLPPPPPLPTSAAAGKAPSPPPPLDLHTAIGSGVRYGANQPVKRDLSELRVLAAQLEEGRPRKGELSSDSRIAIVTAIASGLSRHAVADVFGVSMHTVRNALKRWNTARSIASRPRSGRPRKLTDADELAIVHATAESGRDAGLALGRALGISAYTVTRIVREHHDQVPRTRTRAPTALPRGAAGAAAAMAAKAAAKTAAATTTTTTTTTIAKSETAQVDTPDSLDGLASTALPTASEPPTPVASSSNSSSAFNPLDISNLSRSG